MLTTVHQMDKYQIDHETLEAMLEVSAKAIHRLCASPAEEARTIGLELQEVYLDLRGAMDRDCHLLELWGEGMQAPAPRQVGEGALLPFQPAHPAQVAAGEP